MGLHINHEGLKHVHPIHYTVYWESERREWVSRKSLKQTWINFSIIFEGKGDIEIGRQFEILPRFTVFGIGVTLTWDQLEGNLPSFIEELHMCVT